MDDPERERKAGPGLGELARLFLKLGAFGFGGPAAHIALMREETVVRRGWLSDREFIDLVSAANLIPGPTSTELAMHIGHKHAGGRGLVMAGVCFIAPAALMVAVLAWGYGQYGMVPEARSLLAGVQAAAAAIIAAAAVQLGKATIRGRLHWAIAAVAVVAALARVQELAVLLLAGVAGVAGASLLRPRAGVSLLSAGILMAPACAAAAMEKAPATISLIRLSGYFLGIGSVLYGSGYVLIAFLDDYLVRETGLLTAQQLLDAVAAGQITPGPLFSTATFVGWILLGPAGALAATVCIFLPSFIVVWLTSPYICRLRESAVVGRFLDGVNAAAVALIAVVALQLASDFAAKPVAVLIFGVCVAGLLFTRLGQLWYLGFGAMAGLAAL